jgi:hypothetical protein
MKKNSEKYLRDVPYNGEIGGRQNGFFFREIRVKIVDVPFVFLKHEYRSIANASSHQ